MASKVRIGKPADWSAKQMEELAKVTPADMELAKLLWKKNVPGKLGKLLETKKEKEKTGSGNQSQQK